ncbi:MAG: carbon-nitrogen hydrolase family protein [Dehalococcoidia bacterium]|nr:carbon-nitrogen hydrolase family protein [Dehalococcoidia bacterium]
MDTLRIARQILRAALLQLVSEGSDQAANLRKGMYYCRKAKDMGADIALFPELWNIGYTACPEEPSARRAWQEQAIERDSGFVNRFRDLAHEINMAIVLTYLEKHGEHNPRNSASVIDRHGEIIMNYSKVHTCDFGMEAALTPGDDFMVCSLDTEGGEVRIGLMICYDREFPESARILMLKGAEIILTPNSCVLDENRIGQFRARAFENMVGVAMANYAAPQLNGHSAAFDPMAFEGENGASRNTLIVEAGEDEGVYMAEFEMDRIRAYRSLETWGNAYRKPRSYHMLTSMEVAPPFVRKDSKR